MSGFPTPVDRFAALDPMVQDRLLRLVSTFTGGMSLAKTAATGVKAAGGARGKRQHRGDESPPS